MSPKENSQNNACAGESSNHRLNWDCNLPSPPKSSTQSRILNTEHDSECLIIINQSQISHTILDNSDNKESGTNQGGGTGDSGLTPGSDHHSSEALPETSQKTSSLSADAEVFIPRQMCQLDF